MKSVVVALVSVLLADSTAARQPSLADTTAWLAAHLPRSAAAADAAHTSRDSLMYEFSGCDLTIKDGKDTTDFGKDAGALHVVTLAFDPSKNHPIPVKLEVLGDSADHRTHYHEWTATVDLRYVDGTSITTRSYVVGASAPNGVTALDVTRLRPNGVQLAVKDSASAMRITEALRRAVSLCQRRE